MRITIELPPGLMSQQPKAQETWESFCETVPHYFRDSEIDYGESEEAANGVAMVRPRFDVDGEAAYLLLSEGFLTRADSLEQHLTLLHEMIHLRRAFGDDRFRWETYEQRLKAAHKAVALLWTDAATMRFRKAQMRVAFTFLRLSEEVVAEKLLKRDFPKWFIERAKYYVRMRRQPVADLVAIKASDPLGAFAPLYTGLCSAFFIPLADGLSEVQAELTALSSYSQERFNILAAESLKTSCLAVRPDLLDVAVDVVATSPLPAYERMVELVQAVEAPAQQPNG